ncbi:MAG: hypothetical protein J5374_05425 [Bacteroidales bacterium]|nr:hypothetical protein [Bacteroidales bacterium]
MARRKKRKKDKGVLAYFPPKRRKDVKALIRALGLVFVKAEMTGQCNENGRLVGR